MLRRCVKLLIHCLRPAIAYLNKRYQQWTKPDTASLVVGTVVDATRSKRDLIAENAFLRHQLIGIYSPCSVAEYEPEGKEKKAQGQGGVKWVNWWYGRTTRNPTPTKQR